MKLSQIVRTKFLPPPHRRLGKLFVSQNEHDNWLAGVIYEGKKYYAYKDVTGAICEYFSFDKKSSFETKEEANAICWDWFNRFKEK